MQGFYQLWHHRESGRGYSVRLEWKARGKRTWLAITGVCQVPDPDAIQPDGTVSDGWYEPGAAVEDLQARRAEFIVLLPRAAWRPRRHLKQITDNPSDKRSS